MKYRVIFVAPVLFSLSFNSEAQSIFDRWPALNSCHEEMAATFHPAEEGNLVPLKSHSSELRNKANQLLKSESLAEFKLHYCIGKSNG